MGANPTRFKDNQIVRMRAAEQKYGIEDMKIYAYMNGRSLEVVGEIIAEEIADSFTLICTVYDADGDMVETKDNCYYGEGLVTHAIKPKVFFNGYPFRFSIFMNEGVNISKIRIVPK